MKITWFMLLWLLPAIQLTAQQKEGTVVYELKYTASAAGGQRGAPGALMTVRAANDIAAMPVSAGSFTPPPPPKFEVSFNSMHMLWKQLDEELPADPNENRVMGRWMMTGPLGGDEITYLDFATGETVQQAFILDKPFLVKGQVSPLNWKITADSRIILGQSCKKAIAVRTDQRQQPTLTDGRMETITVMDTVQLTAWFTPDVPVPVAPQVGGQLPGLVLELEITAMHTKTTYTAISLTDKVKLSAIRPPAKGKKISTADFVKEQDRQFKNRRSQMPMQAITIEAP